PDMEWLMDLNLLFYGEKRGDGSTHFMVASAGGHIHTSGIAPGRLAQGLKETVDDAFQQPMDLGSVPKDIEVVSVKITSDGDLMIFIAPSSKPDGLYSWKVEQVQGHLDDFAGGR